MLSPLGVLSTIYNLRWSIDKGRGARERPRGRACRQGPRGGKDAEVFEAAGRARAGRSR